jgi:DNA segregation ATPase FtsK/SpoIIIE, S-DNA-T family
MPGVLKDAIEAFQGFQGTMNARYYTLTAQGRRKITRADGECVYLIVIDEYAYFSATVGSKKEREDFAALTRDLVACGRAAGVIIILATQRPSHQVIDPLMRDLFCYRWAFALDRLTDRGLHTWRQADRQARQAARPRK